jgi:GNAT superfamily N-acetyltransferase
MAVKRRTRGGNTMADEIKFRRAKLTDLSAIISLLADDVLGRQREDVGSPLNPKYVEAFRVIDADSNQLLVVATYGNTVVGTLQLTFIPGLSRKGGWRGQIEGVRIASSSRGSGLGQQMVEWAIENCKIKGCDLIQLTTDKARPDAHRFYEKLGFVGSHVGYKLSLN